MDSVEILETIEPVAEEWDELVDRTRPRPFLRPGWIAAWWQSFGEGALELVVLRRGRRLAGVVPLSRSRGAVRAPANWHTPEFGLVSEDGDAATLLARAVLARAPRHLWLGFLDPANGAELAACRDAARASGYRVLERPLQYSPAVKIDGSWAAYDAALSVNLRADVRRRRRRLAEAGETTVEVADGGERLDELLAEGFRLEASGWKERQGTAIVSRPATRRFYAAISRWAAERGSLRLAFLRLDGRALAFHLDLEEAGRLYHLKGGYDPAYGSFSPGKVLHAALIEDSFTRGLTRYEFLGAADDYKLQWSNAVRVAWLLQAFAPSPSGLIDWAAFAYGRPIAKRALAVRAR